MVETDQNNRSDRIPGLDPVDLARMQRDARKASARELDKAQVFLLKTLITVNGFSLAGLCLKHPGPNKKRLN